MNESVRVFTALSEEFVELFMKHHPVAATGAGIHDYDHLMPDDSPEGLKERASWLRDLEQRLVASVPWDELPVETRVDFALLRSRISALRADIEEIKIPQKTPALFLRRSFLAIHLLLARTFAPLDERKEAVVARLMAIPDYLDGARPNLREIPDVLLEDALEIAAQGPGFVDEVVRTLLRHFPGEAERLEHAGSRARTGFLRFHDFLDREMRATSTGTFAIGERWMNYKLEREHLLPWTCAQIEQIGRDQLAFTHSLLEQEANRLDPTRTWREHYEEGRQRHPEAHWLSEAYLGEMERAKAFIADKKLMPLPLGEKLEIVDTPMFQRATTPWTSYQSPAPFDTEQTGFFCVTPVDLRRSKEEQALQLAGHCLPLLPVTVIHEVWPGHHLQRCFANRAATRLRRITVSDLFLEGWALYCEEFMFEQGFFRTDPLTRLFQLRHQLWRACRMILDAGLHSGRVTIDEGVQMLIDEAGLEPAAARAEVRRACTQPTHLLGGLAGKLQILELRDEVQARMGARFSIHDFHAALLEAGTLPPALVREEIGVKLAIP